MKVHMIVSPDFGENTYLVEAGDGIAVIDPGADPEAIKLQIANSKLKIRYILLTHGHYDHILGAAALNAPVYAHESERNALVNPAVNLSTWLPAGGELTLKGVNYYNGEKHEMGGFTFYHTPGHTAGCVVIKYDGCLFTGDTLFVDTVGRTDVPTGDAKKLQASLKLFLTLDKSLTCYPGHGEPFTLEQAFKVNYFLKDK
jgi:glyoxylase-like metal-dependent hydrolase (beta-lactamase superfamily II)